MVKPLQLLQSFLVKHPEDINILSRKGLLQDFIWRLQHVDISSLGAQLAYFFLLSFFPMMIFFLGVVPYLQLNPNNVYQLMQEVMPDTIFRMVKQVLEPILTQQNSNILSLGALGTLWSASNGVNALMGALNQAYNLDTKMTFQDRFWSVAFTLLFLGLMVVALALPIFGGLMLAFVRQYWDISEAIGVAWTLLRWLVPPVLIFSLLTVIYWVVPKTTPRLQINRVFSGAAVASIAWVLLTYGFSTYISHFGNYSATYGSIGGVIVLMLWLYFTGIILIVGGIINATFQRRYDAQRQRHTTLTDPPKSEPTHQ